jgi:hypothetical protein
MRFPFAAAVVLGLASFTFAGSLAPLTLKDVSLMLRSGYSSDAVEREVAARHFSGPLDATGEKNLVQAGASPGLISGLKSGALQFQRVRFWRSRPTSRPGSSAGRRSWKSREN